MDRGGWRVAPQESDTTVTNTFTFSKEDLLFYKEPKDTPTCDHISSALKSEGYWVNMKVKFSSLTSGLWLGLRAEPLGD